MANKKPKETHAQLLKRAMSGEISAHDIVEISKNLKQIAKGHLNDAKVSEQIKAAQLIFDRVIGSVLKEEAAKEQSALEATLDRLNDTMANPPTPKIVDRREESA